VKSRLCLVDLRWGAPDAKRRQPLWLTDQEGDWWETGFHREYPGAGSRQTVCGPSLDLLPEGFHVSRHGYTWREDVGPIEEYRDN